MNIIELIFLIVLGISFIGLAVVLLRKVSVLSKLSEPEGDLIGLLVSGVKNGTKNLPAVRNFSYEIYLQKLLSRVRVLTLKTDHKTSGWLEKLRQKNHKKNHANNDKYWDELKKAKNGR
jgi:hypothetical protein